MIEGERILVTGATGQVARTIAETLAERNEVWAGARFSDPEAKVDLEAAGIRTTVFDLGDADLTHMPDVDYVVHCAAATMPRTPDEGMRINAEGTGFLMERYRDAKGFFAMSSSSVYRTKPDDDAVYSETDELGGYSTYAPHYAMSKLCGEAVTRFQSRRLGLPAIMARLNVAYGTNGHGGLPMVLFDLMRHGVPFKQVAGRRHWCSPIHQDDIAAQVEALLEAAEVGAPVVNLGGDEPVTLEDIIAHIEELTGGSMSFVEAGESDWGTQILDSTTRVELGGPCRVGWRDGVASALAHRHPDAIIAPDRGGRG